MYVFAHGFTESYREKYTHNLPICYVKSHVIEISGKTFETIVNSWPKLPFHSTPIKKSNFQLPHTAFLCPIIRYIKKKTFMTWRQKQNGGQSHICCILITIVIMTYVFIKLYGEADFGAQTVIITNYY